MNKILKTAIALVALTSAFSFAQEGESGGFKLGFYGTVTETPFIGVLFNLGTGLEFGLGIHIHSESETSEGTVAGSTTTNKTGLSTWAIAPSVAYQIGKKDFVGYGAGLDITFGSSSTETTNDGQTTTTKPESVDMGFYPNFFLKAEIVKNFAMGLRTGLVIKIPSEEKQDPMTTTFFEIGTRTEMLVYFYL